MAEVPVLASFGWLASPLFKTLLNRAHDYLGTGIDKRRKILEATVLRRLSLAIEKLEKSPQKEQLVDWLRKLKDAYYEAEEAIDLLEYEKLKQEVKDHRNTLQQKENKEKRRTRICSPSQFVPQHLKIASVKFKYGLYVSSRKKKMLKGCIDKLVEIAKEANEFRDLLEVHENATGSDPDRETISVPPIRVFGREIDKEKIVSLLTQKNSGPGPSTRTTIPIIVIIGRSGAGKTALAQYVYEHMDGHDHFDLLVWMHAPRKFKATDVIKNMREIIKAKEHDSNDYRPTCLEALFTEIKSMLGSKKLLLAFDDFWNDTEDFVEQWEKFIGCLTRCSPGSRILLTTQSKNVAEKVNLPGATEVTPYDLQEIEEDQFLELFMHYAWSNNSHLKKEEFKIIGRKIAVKLERNPGAAKLVGHQLRGKLDLRYWEEVAENDWLGDYMKVSIQRYQKLPQNLQRCFAICSLFPKGTQLPRELLIYLWMAEGFVVPKYKQDRLEDISENYLHELTSRFFLQRVVDSEKKIFYQLHDLHHNLAEQVQGDDCIRIDSTNSREVISFQRSNMLNIRHIFLPSRMINRLKETLCLMKNVRTFCVQSDGGFVPKKELEEILKHMGKLRVLVLPKCGDELPNSIGKLKHLRYLHINGFVLETNEPINAICKLPHLRFVDLSFTGIKSLPDEFCALLHLEVLYVRGCNFEKLPEGMNQLINLRHLYASSHTISLISGIGKLTKLQELEEFRIGEHTGHRISELMYMNNLSGHLHLRNLNNVSSKEEAAKSQLDKKVYLKGLELRFDYNDHEPRTEVQMEVLEALKPTRTLEILKVGGCRWESFPSWVLSPSHDWYYLKVIDVYSFELSSLPAFGELPCLELLSFDDLPLIKQVGTEFYGSSDVVFPSLKELKFSRMSSWRKWLEVGRVVFPHLKKLHLEKCSLLEKLPTDSFTSSTVELILSDCPGLCNIQGMPSIEVLHITDIKELRFVGGLKSLVNLKKLVIVGFHKFVESHEVEQENDEISQEKYGEQCLQFLTYMHLCHNKKIWLWPSTFRSLPIVGRLPSLRTLLIEHYPSKEYTRDGESWFEQLTSLENLEFRNCLWLRSLPSQLRLLTSLKKLNIYFCPSMLTLPKNGLPPNLLELYIDECPHLTHRYQPNQRDWDKISHIQLVRFDKEIVTR